MEMDDIDEFKEGISNIVAAFNARTSIRASTRASNGSDTFHQGNGGGAAVTEALVSECAAAMLSKHATSTARKLWRLIIWGVTGGPCA
jgi:hypothetical protein